MVAVQPNSASIRACSPTGRRLAADDKGALRRLLKAAQPAQDFVGVGVRRQHRQVGDFGADRNPAAVDLDLTRPAQQRLAAGARRLIAAGLAQMLGAGDRASAAQAGRSTATCRTLDQLDGLSTCEMEVSRSVTHPAKPNAAGLRPSFAQLSSAR